MMDDNHDEDDLSKSIQGGKGISVKRRTTRNESEKRRRDKLNVYITELASMVPTCEGSQKKLDKTSILKMTVNYMRIHNDLTGSVLGQEHGLHLSFLSSDEIGQLMDEALHGFLFVLSNDREIVYVSKSVMPLLGLEWEQVRGSDFIDLVHPDDKAIVGNELERDNMTVFMRSEPNGFAQLPRKPTRHSFEIRMACNPGNQRIENTSSYERVRIIGYTNSWDVKKNEVAEDEMNVSGTEIVPKDASIVSKSPYFVAVGCLSRPAPQRFVDLEESAPAEFESRHTMDGKFLFVDPRSVSMTGYWPYELLGTSLYNYVHHDDMKMLASFHQSLLEFGEGKTEPYRMRSKGQQWVWMKSRSFISYNHWNSKPEFFCSKNVAVCDKQELFTPQDRSIVCNTPQLQAGGQSTSDDIYLQQGEPLHLLPNLSTETPEILAQQSTVIPRGGANSNLNLVDINSSRPSTVSDQRSRSHSVEDDSDSTDSVDLSMSYEELESFIEAQRQLHDQLMLKHTILEEAITKQKHQLQAVQQQMLLNLQAQLTLDPSKSQELFEDQFRKAKEFSEMHEKQETRQKELVQTLKETRKRVEKRNRKQLKYYREKHPKLSNVPEGSFAPPFTQGSGEGAPNHRPLSVSSELTHQRPPRVLSPEQFDSAKQPENIQVVVQNPGPLLPQVNTQGQGFVTQTFSSHHRQLTQLSSPPQLTFHNVENTSAEANPSIMSPREFPPQITIVTNEPTTLNNIQNLLTASSQNPQAMQKLLSGLRSQPEVAQTLLDLLKQAQASETSEKDSLLFSQSLQNTTEQFSAALNTTASFGAATVNRSMTSQAPFQPGFSLQELQQQRQHHQSQAPQPRQRLSNTSTSRKKFNQTRHERMLKTSQTRTAAWTSSMPTETQTGNTMSQGNMDSFAAMSDHSNRSSQANLAPNSNKDKHKEQGKPKDYFSSFSAQELQAMILTSSPKSRATQSEEGSAASLSQEESKLREEESSHSPLLVQQQQLLQMHQDQRKQLLIQQQEQLFMSFQQSKPPPQPETASASNQNMFISFTQNPPRSLLTNSQPGTSSEGQVTQSSTSNNETSQPSTSWDSGAANFELNDADEVVLNMLLAQSSVDTLFDSSPWPETDSLLEYLNMNPDLTSD